MKELTKPVVIEFLTRTGIEDIYQDWEVSTKNGGKTVVFKGPMSKEAMRLMVSFIELPAPLPDAQPPNSKPRPSGKRLPRSAARTRTSA